MKKLLLFIFSIFLAVPSFSTHLMGGQITARPVSGRTYAVTMTLYRDVLGIPMYVPDFINYESRAPLSPWTLNNNVPAIGTSFINGTEEYVYEDTVTFPMDGSYTIWFSNCCRNSAILNGPADESFYLKTIVEVDSLGPNTTPEFLNKPITLAGVNNLWTYNPLPYDADGDSLAWHLVVPLLDEFTLNTYVAPSADPTQPFTLDSLTGQITWIPNLLGNFVASFLVEEFRGGVKLGEIRRDMQIIVIPATGSRPAFTNTGWPVNPQGDYQFELTDNNIPFLLPVAATDADMSYIDLNAVGEPFLLAANPAHFTSLMYTTGNAWAYFDWTPTSSQVRHNPYVIVVRCNESNGPWVMSQDVTILLRVNHATGIREENPVLTGAVYPTVVTNELKLPLTLAKSCKLELNIYNAVGQKTNYNYTYKLNPGTQLITLQDLNLPGGIYFIRISDGEHFSVQKFISGNR